MAVNVLNENADIVMQLERIANALERLANDFEQQPRRNTDRNISGLLSDIRDAVSYKR